MPTFTDEQRRLAPDFQGIHIDNVTCRGAWTAIKASGIKGLDCVHDIDIRNTTIVYHHNDKDIDPQTARLTLDNVTLVKE